MWVAESSWDGAELGTCGQQSWCGQMVIMMPQCDLRPGSRAWRRGWQDRSDPGVNHSSMGTAFPLTFCFIFFGNL